MKTKKVLIRLVIVLLLCVLAFALWRIADTLLERSAGKALNRELTQLAVTEKEVPTMETDAEGPAAYVVPIEVDFDLLRQQAPDAVAWLYSPDTPIHYPVVQGPDNRYYLKHTVTGQQNHTGSIFLDRRNPSDLTGSYNLIHGHNLKDDTMFGTLPRYSDQAYYDDHAVLYLLTPDADYAIELFAGFTTDKDDVIYRIPALSRERMELAQYCMERSDFVSSVQPQQDDRFVILSTCAYDYDDARYAVIGILRETEPQSAYAEENQ